MAAKSPVEVAKECGVEHIISYWSDSQGLAKAFMAGLEASLKAGADIIVNTDADNEYCAEDIPQLIRPILLGQAEIVVGGGPISEIKHFSPVKNSCRSWAVGWCALLVILIYPMRQVAFAPLAGRRRCS